MYVTKFKILETDQNLSCPNPKQKQRQKAKTVFLTTFAAKRDLSNSRNKNILVKKLLVTLKKIHIMNISIEMHILIEISYKHFLTKIDGCRGI